MNESVDVVPRFICSLAILVLMMSAIPLIPATAHEEGEADTAFPLIELPPGFTIEKYADGLTFPTGMTWDDQGRMYVAEAGGGLNPE